MDFLTLFRSGDPRRDAFLSRLFGIFSEEIVRSWTGDARAPYLNHGRPTVVSADGARHTLDFALEHRVTGRFYVAEQKSELQFEGYKYLRLDKAEQVKHHLGSAAFRAFVAVPADPRSVEVHVEGKVTPVDGAILVWGAVSDEGRREAIERYRFADVLSLEEMLADLREWRSEEWLGRLNELQRWANELFDGLR